MSVEFDQGETNLVTDNDAYILSVSEGTLSLSEPVCSEQPAASSNSDNVSHQINASFQNSSYPGDSDILSYPTPVIKKKTAQRQKFFLLTSSEAPEAKLKEIREKAIQEEKRKQSKKLDQKRSKKGCKQKMTGQQVKIRLKVVELREGATNTSRVSREITSRSHSQEWGVRWIQTQLK